MVCSICEKRKAVRFCPAKGEKICAVCCGTEREVTLDCPADCSYLIAAHRYEDEHRRELPADTPLLDVDLPHDVIHIYQQLLATLAFAVAKFCMTHQEAADPAVLAAVQALAETYKTLSTGIYYEQQPAAPLARELYDALAAVLAEAKQEQAAHPGGLPAKDADIFALLVFLFRMGLLRGNGRPRSRRFIEFLRAQFPQAKELQREDSRIILP